MGAAAILEDGYQRLSMELTEDSLIGMLARRNEAAFEEVFKTHYKHLHAYAISLLKDEMQAEESVQQVFFRMWDRAENLQIAGSVAAYLYRAVHNECLNYLKHQKVKASHQLHVAYSMKQQTDQPGKNMAGKELESRIREALNELPEQCRTVFQLSRFEELKYREIADKLNISVKTVENQMGKALRILRTRLAEFLSVLLLLFNR